MLLFDFTRPFLAVYDNTDGGGNEGGSGGDGAGDPPPPIVPPTPPKTFTQDELNKIIAQERRTFEDKTKKTIADLETLKASKNLTEKEQTQLKTRLEELQRDLLTKEQLAEQEKKKLETDYKSQIDTLSNQKQMWEDKYKTTTILRTISDIANKEEAFDSDQIIAILRPDTRLVDIVGDDDKPTGELIPKVKMASVDKEGKPVTLDLTVPEAVKIMKSQPKFANLFKETAKGGLGLEGGQRSAVIEVSKDPAAYRANRAKIIEKASP